MRTELEESIGQNWKPLLKLGAVTARIMAGIIIVQAITFMAVPPPYEGSALDWFTLFQNNRLIGLVEFELLMVVYVILSIPMTLALYVLLRQTSQSFLSVYLALSLVGIISFIAARPVFEMLFLSNGYAAAATEAQRALYLSAGEMSLAAFHGTAFHVSYVLGSISGLIVSLVMLKSNLFGRATAYMRIASSLFDFGLYVPAIGIFLSLLSVLFLLIWNILIARRLLQLAR